jgi:hypothetical protein
MIAFWCNVVAEGHLGTDKRFYGTPCVTTSSPDSIRVRLTHTCVCDSPGHSSSVSANDAGARTEGLLPLPPHEARVCEELPHAAVL